MRSKRVFRWTLFALYVLLIYTTLYPARLLTLWLRQHHLLFRTLLLVYALILLGGILVYRRCVQKPHSVSLPPLFAMLALCVLVFRNTPYLDQRIHLAEYGLLAFLALWAVSLHTDQTGQAFLSAFVLTGAVGVGDELLQAVTPLRTCSTGDMLANALQGGIGLGFSAIFMRRWQVHHVFWRIVLTALGAVLLWAALTQNYQELFRKYLS